MTLIDTVITVLQRPDEESFFTLLTEQFQVCESKAIDKIKTRVLNCFQAMQEHKTLTLLVAINSQIIIGYIIIQWLKELWTDFPEAFISNFYVSSRWRNQGVGSLLLDAAISEAKKCKAARLFLENSQKNPIYRSQFYLKRNWQERSDITIFEFSLKEKE